MLSINKKPNNRTDEMTGLKHGLALSNRYAARRIFKSALLVLFGMPAFLITFVLTSEHVLGQDKWVVTPSRGGTDGAKAQAQMTAILKTQNLQS